MTTPTDAELTGSQRMEKIVALCKRRGFVFPASEIYGGINGFWDYGPLGAQLKNNLRDAWWRDMVEAPPIGPDGHPVSIVGLDSSIVQNPKAWVASVWKRTPRSRLAAASSARGWSTPVSLFAAMTDAKSVSPRSALANSAGSTRPSPSTPRRVTS